MFAVQLLEHIQRTSLLTIERLNKSKIIFYSLIYQRMEKEREREREREREKSL